MMSRQIWLAVFCTLTALSVGAEEVKSIKLTATISNIIGMFSTFGQPNTGDTFELDLENLPKDKLIFAPPSSNPKRDLPTYIFFRSPLVVDSANAAKRQVTSSHCIRLISTFDKSKLVIQMYASALEKGAKVRIYIYEEFDGAPHCMAEAEGVIK